MGLGYMAPRETHCFDITPAHALNYNPVRRIGIRILGSDPRTMTDSKQDHLHSSSAQTGQVLKSHGRSELIFSSLRC